MKLDIKALLKEGPILLDGATGTNLFEAGMPSGVCPEIWLCDHQDVLLSLQKGYCMAGSQIIYAPTFSGNPIKLAEYGAVNRLEEINQTLVRLSKQAIKEAGCEEKCYVAGNLTMTGQSLKPTGPLEFEELVDCYKKQIAAILVEGVDLFVIETMMSLAETRAAILAVKEMCDLPIFVTMTFEQNGKTLYGTDPVTALVTVQALGIDAFGINCSCGPKQILPWMKELKKYAKLPLIVKPNAGLPQMIDGQTTFDMDSYEFSQCMLEMIKAGVGILGGCCGTTPAYIVNLKENIEKHILETNKWDDIYENICKQPEEKYRRVLTSERAHFDICLDGGMAIVGEQINPTGKKKLQEALRENRLEDVCTMAESQESLGAKVLDINVGTSGVCEETLLPQVVMTVTEVVSTPLCIDSGNPKAVEATLRLYPGRALVNSVSLEKKKIEEILPLVKKYGAMFILLPVRDEGMPSTFNERIENIEELIALAAHMGFTKEDIIVDGLVSAAGAVPTAGRDTLETIKWCKAHDLATICGLSNISFGLPMRQYVNSTFLALALSCGLTMAIANPSQEMLMLSGFAADLLLAKQDANLTYIDACQKINSEKQTEAPKQTPDQAKNILSDTKEEYEQIIYQDVIKGKAKNVVAHVKLALEANKRADVLLNDVLIPAITKVGELFAEQKYYLPQLMLSAEAMKKAVDVLEPELLKNNKNEKGPGIVIATVKGDVHDIGKNLVAMMLKNYGFDVVDLGKDVDKETIISAVEENHSDIIVLSALMTTTMQYMKEVIALARIRTPWVKVMIGGAATTESFAEEIGADGYSKDAVSAVELAKKLVN